MKTNDNGRARTNRMKMNWINQLGKHFLKSGALTYLVEESYESWDGEEATKQKPDMIVLFPNKVVLVELKETDALHRKGINFKQMERYHYICRNTRYEAELWVFTYWKKYDIITGAKMDKAENLQFYAIDNKDNQGDLQFFASIGVDPSTRIRKKVDFMMRVEQ